MAIPAFAQDDANAELEQAARDLFAAVTDFDRAALEAAVAEDAEVALSYQGVSVLSRGDFLAFAGAQDLSSLSLTEVDARAIGAMGFVEMTMEMPGFVDGFFYGVFTKATPEAPWVLTGGVIDPMSGMMSDGQTAKMDEVVAGVKDTIGTMAKEGDLQPMIDSLNAEHCRAIVAVGPQIMVNAVGADKVAEQIKMLGAMAGQMGGSGLIPEIPDDPADLPFPAGQIVGNSVLVMWAEPTIPIMGNDTTLRSAILFLVEDGEPTVIGIVAGVDLDMAAAMGGGGV